MNTNELYMYISLCVYVANKIYFIFLANWDSSKIFRPLHERHQEEEDIYHIRYQFQQLQNEQRHNERFHTMTEKSTFGDVRLNNYDQSGVEQIVDLYNSGEVYDSGQQDKHVVVRRAGPRHRKAANMSRSSSSAGNYSNGNLHGRRPLSMSCLLATTPNSHKKYSQHFGETIYEKQTILSAASNLSLYSTQNDDDGTLKCQLC